MQKRMSLENILRIVPFALALSAAPLAAASSADALLDKGTGKNSKSSNSIIENITNKPAPGNYLRNRIEIKKHALEPTPLLRDVLNDSSLTKEEKEMYKSLSDDMRAATGTKGDWIYFKQCHTNVDGKDVPVNISAKYIHGPEGGSGETEITVWLSEEFWYCYDTGIERVVLHLFSKEKTSMSTRMYDINLNQHLKLATHASVDYRIKGSDIIANPTEEIIRKVLKEVGFSATTINKLFILQDAYNALLKNDETERALSVGNRLVKGFHIYDNSITYNGYFGNETGSGLRAPKLFQCRIKRGEENLPAAQFKISVRRYEGIYLGKGYVGEKRRRGNEIVVEDTIPLVGKKNIPVLEKVIDKDTLDF